MAQPYNSLGCAPNLHPGSSDCFHNQGLGKEIHLTGNFGNSRCYCWCPKRFNSYLLLVFVKGMRLEAAPAPVRHPLSAHMLQIEVWVPRGDVSVFFCVAAAFIEPAANPPRNLGRGVSFFSLTFAFVSSPFSRFGSSLAGSDPASEVR